MMNLRHAHRALLALLLLALLVPHVAADTPPFAPMLPPAVRGQDSQNPHPATTDIPPLTQDVTLSAKIAEPDANGRIRVDGTERIALTNTGAKPVRAATFGVPAAHYGWFTLDSGTIDGVPAAVDQAEMRVGFPEWPGIDPGATRTVSFTFHLSIGDGGDGYDATRRDGAVLRLGYWFPMLSDDHGYEDSLDAIYTATANFHVTLDTPADQALAPTGVITNRTAASDRVTYTIDAPNVRDFAALLSPDYQILRATTKDKVAVELYTVPDHYAQNPERPQRMLDDAVRSIEQMSAWVGPYAYPIYRVVDAGPTMPGGIEFPMLSMVGSRLRNVDVLVAHETAHQWFFGMIGTHPQTEPWIDEGAASFFERAIYDGIDVSVSLSRTLPCDVSAGVWDGLSDRDLVTCVYDGGRKLYADLRDAMGTDSFLAALHDLFVTNRYGIVTARDVLTTFQRHSPHDLRPAAHRYLSYDWIDALPPPGG